MPRKKSVRRCAEDFIKEVEAIDKFVSSADFPESDVDYISWIHDYAIIRAYDAFERLILNALVAAINNDTSVLGDVLGIKLPRHLTDEVCEYLVTSNRYFDFKGRQGLIDILKHSLRQPHYLTTACSHENYRQSLERLCALRNYAAHRSDHAKRAALKAVGQQRMGSAGSWLKRRRRLRRILDDLLRLAEDIRAGAPY